MKLHFHALALAAATMVSGGAQAALALPSSTSLGNSSVIFVAIDSNDSISLAIDLGISMSYFTNSTTWIDELQSTGAKTWNFATNTTSESGITGNDWSSAYNAFKATQMGGDYRWAVLAADQVQGSGTTVSASNVIAGRGFLTTGNVTEAQMLFMNSTQNTNIGSALGNVNNYMAAIAFSGTLNSAENGAATATAADGTRYLGSSIMGGNFGGRLQGWNYFMADGQTSTFQYLRSTVADPNVFQFGVPTATDTLAATPVFWQFDIATDTLVLAVPEPSTYAMLVAGLAAVGFMARRRKA